MHLTRDQIIQYMYPFVTGSNWRGLKYSWMTPPRDVDGKIRRGMMKDQAQLDELGRLEIERRAELSTYRVE